MTCPIVNTALETKLAIVETLQANGISENLLNLSCTCHPFRELLLPDIFRKIVLRNEAESGRSVQAIVDGECRHYVKDLHYKGKDKIPE
jgi:hypothetical protein